MTPFIPDPKSVAGQTLAVQERTEVLVIGAGPAGLAAGMEAARLGLSVVLVDENPTSAETMGENVPLHFGGTMGGAARNPRAMLEAMVASDPGIAEAFEAGIDIRLGTACWGLYAPGPNLGWLPGPVAGLMDETRSWIIAAGRIVVATGRRDMGLAFQGWEKEGVAGVTAAERLATRYGAFAARRAILLGSSTESVQSALALRAAGVEILAIVEQAAAPLAPAAVLAPLLTGGTTLLLGQVPLAAEGSAQVEALVLRAIETGAEMRIACDSVLLGIGTVPVIDLLDAAGAQVAFDAARGGVVPVLGEAQATSLTGIYAAGDCSGIWPAKTLDPAIARAEGRRAVNAEVSAMAAAPSPAYDLGSYRLDWVRAAVIAAEGEPHVCQCEEVTAREILEVRPPRYLGWEDASGSGARHDARDLLSLLGESPPNPDQVKRLTRAGMGLCQGRRCREQVTALLALASGEAYGAIPPATYRAPVRPMRMSMAARAAQESQSMAQHWDVWFGMPAQYLPFWEVPETYTVAGRDKDAEAASE